MSDIRLRDVLFVALIASAAMLGTELLMIGGSKLYRKVRS